MIEEQKKHGGEALGDEVARMETMMFDVSTTMTACSIEVESQRVRHR